MEKWEKEFLNSRKTNFEKKCWKKYFKTKIYNTISVTRGALIASLHRDKEKTQMILF